MADLPQPLHPAPRCRDCGVDLEPGFTPDLAHGQTQLARWIPGSPRKSWLQGEVSRGQYARDALPTITYRCPKCFRLESFAPPPTP